MEPCKYLTLFFHLIVFQGLKTFKLIIHIIYRQVYQLLLNTFEPDRVIAIHRGHGVNPIVQWPPNSPVCNSLGLSNDVLFFPLLTMSIKKLPYITHSFSGYYFFVNPYVKSM